jgi:anaerobic ribonucleoside-triphosphate reductase activating protein
VLLVIAAPFIGGTEMNYANIKTFNTENGEGIRLSLFVSGCTNCCEGCFNKETWDFSYGKPFTEETINSIVDELKKPFYDGLTILGGEPFEICNQSEVLKLIERVKKEIPERNIWMYTGFTYNVDLIPGGRRYIPDVTDKILNSIDVLVDGKFILEEKDLKLNFRGSKNQRIILMEETRRSNEIVLSPLNN